MWRTAHAGLATCKWHLSLYRRHLIILLIIWSKWREEDSSTKIIFPYTGYQESTCFFLTYTYKCWDIGWSKFVGQYYLTATPNILCGTKYEQHNYCTSTSGQLVRCTGWQSFTNWFNIIMQNAPQGISCLQINLNALKTPFYDRALAHIL